MSLLGSRGCVSLAGGHSTGSQDGKVVSGGAAVVVIMVVGAGVVVVVGGCEVVVGGGWVLVVGLTGLILGVEAKMGARGTHCASASEKRGSGGLVSDRASGPAKLKRR